MLEIKIEAPGLSAAIEKLAEALSKSTFAAPALIAPPDAAPAPAPAPVAAAVSAPTSTVPTLTAAAHIPAPAPVQVPNAQTAPAAAVPVAPAPTYTLDQISKAGAALVDIGKMEQLLALLGKYGVAAVTQLAPDQYGIFATELRALGAQI